MRLSLEYLCLRCLEDNPIDAHGLAVWKRLVEDGNKVSDSSVYTTLERLHAKGFLSFEWVDGTHKRGGRRKRIFKIEAPGKKALSEYEQRLVTPHLRLARGLA